VDVEHIRVVDFGVDTEWRPTRRTNGFANAHYASGWFRVANGETIRMYRAGGTRLVLLPPKGDGAALLLEVGSPRSSWLKCAIGGACFSLPWRPRTMPAACFRVQSIRSEKNKS